MSTMSRRRFLAASLAFAGTSTFSSWAKESATRPRLIVINLRGGMDSLAVVAPTGDPHYQQHRPSELYSTQGWARLDDTFVLHPQLQTLGRLFAAGQASIVHACATPYRGRSHFDAQDVLESGLPNPGRADSGWLNRAISAVHSGTAGAPHALAIGAQVPLILRGSAPVMSWLLPGYPAANASTRERLLALYGQTSPQLADIVTNALALDELTGGEAGVMSKINKSEGVKGYDRQLDAAARTAATVLSNPEGANIAVMDIRRWDTHRKQAPLDGHLAEALKSLDLVFDRLHQGLASVWSSTAILVVTEFGRTVRFNGTEGTDHGTATAAFLAGGAVRGGRVYADWPGLSESHLLQNRDLLPTTDLRSVFKGVLADHLGIDNQTLNQKVFPGSLAATPLASLIVS